MTVYESIKAMKIEALKVKNPERKQAFTFIQGELERQGKDPSDEKALKTLRSLESALRKEYGETLEVSILSELLEKYTPKQLTEDQIKSIILELGAGSVGEVQKHFKQNYTGQYDGGVVTRIYKEL